MKSLWEFLSQFWQHLRPWTIVNPWQQALRVRLGKRVTRLGPGIHWKLPFVHSIFAQSVRRRIVALNTQTITTKDWKTATLSASMAYEIVDLELLYRKIHHAEDTLVRLGMAALAGVVRDRISSDCDQAAIERAATGILDPQFAPFGIGGIAVYLTGFAFVKTYRLISDPAYGIMGDQLSTIQEHNA